MMEGASSGLGFDSNKDQPSFAYEQLSEEVAAIIADSRPTMLDPPVDVGRDHILGPPEGDLVLVQYGSYACFWCRAVHNVIEQLRSRFGERMQYVFRHLPVAGNELATRAAELSEYAAQTTGRFWEAHEALMEQGPVLAESDLGRIAQDFKVPPSDGPHNPAREAAKVRVREDIESAHRSGVQSTPAFFINGRRYTGPWDESCLRTQCWPPSATGYSPPPLSLFVGGPLQVCCWGLRL